MDAQNAPFACYVCDTPFGANETLNRHLKSPGHVRAVNVLRNGESNLPAKEVACRLKTPSYAGGWDSVTRNTQEQYLAKIPEEDFKDAHNLMRTRREMGQRQPKRKAARTEESSEDEEQEVPGRLKSVVVVPQSLEEELGGDPDIDLQAEEEVSNEEPQLAYEYDLTATPMEEESDARQ